MCESEYILVLKILYMTLWRYQMRETCWIHENVVETQINKLKSAEKNVFISESTKNLDHIFKSEENDYKSDGESNFNCTGSAGTSSKGKGGEGRKNVVSMQIHPKTFWQ
jgi:hypothetical protein